MTLAKLEARIVALEAEIRELKAILATKEPQTRSWLDTFGKYADDPDYLEAARLGKEYRDRVNRESLEEFDREEREAKTKKKARPRKTNARP